MHDATTTTPPSALGVEVMERNPGDMQENSGQQDSSSSRPGWGDGGASNISGSGMSGATGMSGSSGSSAASDLGQGASMSGSTSASSSSSQSASGSSSMSDRADALKSGAQEQLGNLKERASELKATLADRLEAGAEKLRSRNDGSAAGAYGSSNATGTFGNGGAGVDSNANRMSQLQDSLAGGMDATARFLREGDLKQSIEQQAKSNPGRTLLVALGVGYVLGRALRGSKEA